MKSLDKQSDFEFVYNIEHCRLDPSEFDHRSHLRLAWINLKNHSVEEAIIRVSNQIKGLVMTFNTLEKYHTTLTIAAVRVVHHFFQKSNSSTFNAFLIEFPALTENFKDLILTHYSKGKLFQPEAKDNYLNPDLMPFD